jgi:hypothetical protein
VPQANAGPEVMNTDPFRQLRDRRAGISGSEGQKIHPLATGGECARQTEDHRRDAAVGASAAAPERAEDGDIGQHVRRRRSRLHPSPGFVNWRRMITAPQARI